jgi:signal transduction histidine kinase
MFLDLKHPLEQGNTVAATLQFEKAGTTTGLGLSISHNIIVKQHGGSIEVDMQPGGFTEFRIVLPRAGPPRTPL